MPTACTIKRFRGDASSDLGLVVRQWSKNLVRLADHWRDGDKIGDLPWAYSERALLSVLAGGVWLLKGSAFEEYAADKRAHLKGARSSGREDVYFTLGKKSYKAEAKHFWAPATRVHPDSKTRVHRKLQAAVKDARRCSALGDQRLGILFASPFINKVHHASLDDRIERWLDEVFEQVPCTVAAAVFPGTARTCCWWPADRDAYPGAAVFIKTA